MLAVLAFLLGIVAGVAAIKGAAPAVQWIQAMASTWHNDAQALRVAAETRAAKQAIYDITRQAQAEMVRLLIEARSRGGQP